MPTAVSIFHEKLIIAIQRLRSGRPARGAILISDSPVPLDQTALRMEAIAFEHCLQLNVTGGSPGPRGQTHSHSLFNELQKLTTAKAELVSKDIALQLADVLQHDASPGLHLPEELVANLFIKLATSARSVDKVLLVIVSDMHKLKLPELAMILSAVHRSNQLRLPVLMCGTGAIQVRKMVGDAAGYGERLFEFVTEPPE